MVFDVGFMRPLLVWRGYWIDGDSEMSKDKLESFEEVAKPLIKWLAENFHPHHTAIVTSTHAELLEGKMAFPTEEFIKD